LWIFGSLIFCNLAAARLRRAVDRIGPQTALIFFGVAGTLGTIPILTTLEGNKSPSWLSADVGGLDFCRRVTPRSTPS